MGLIRKGRIMSLNGTTEKQNGNSLAGDSIGLLCDTEANSIEQNQDLAKGVSDKSSTWDDANESATNWKYSVMLYRLLRSSKVMSNQSLLSVNMIQIPTIEESEASEEKANEKNKGKQKEENFLEPTKDIVREEFTIRRSARKANSSKDKDSSKGGSMKQTKNASGGRTS